MLIYELVAGNPPFYRGDGHEAMYRRIVSVQYSVPRTFSAVRRLRREGGGGGAGAVSTPCRHVGLVRMVPMHVVAWPLGIARWCAASSRPGPAHPVQHAAPSPCHTGVARPSRKSAQPDQNPTKSDGRQMV